MTIPSVRTNALGTGAFLGLYANLRYQLLCGIDRGLSSYFDVIGVALFCSTALRCVALLINISTPPKICRSTCCTYVGLKIVMFGLWSNVLQVQLSQPYMALIDNVNLNLFPNSD